MRELDEKFIKSVLLLSRFFSLHSLIINSKNNNIFESSYFVISLQIQLDLK